MKDSHFKTPRTMAEAFGNDTRLATGQRESLWAYIAACGIAVAIVAMLCVRG